MFVCKRCLVEFKQKSNLINHLNRKNICMAIESDILPNELIKELNDKGEDKVECSKCNNIYKNKNSLRMHKCKAINSINELEDLKKDLINKLELQQKEIYALKNKMNYLEKKPANITNNTTNNLNITLNCLRDCSGKPIEYLLKDKNLDKKVIELLKPNKFPIPYLKEKFYNPEHPENGLIRKGKTQETIEIHYNGQWREFKSPKAADYILTNMGIDYTIIFETLRDYIDFYEKNKSIIKRFNNEIMKPLEWGVDLEAFEIQIESESVDDVIEEEKKEEITNKLIDFVHYS